MELPTAEIGRWPELARGTLPPEARVRRHEGSLPTVQTVVPRHQETISTTLVTSGAPQPSVVPRRHAARCCGVQQQCRRRPHLVRPAAVCPHDPRGHDRCDSGVLRPLGCELQGEDWRFGWESKPTGLARLCAKSAGCFLTSLAHRAGPYRKRL